MITMKICPICRGSRQIECTDCGGYGWIGWLNPDDEPEECVNCSGNGRTPCKFCGGQGTVENPVYFKFLKYSK